MLCTYFFDIKNSVATRDRTGLQFQTVGGAIEHSKDLALRLRSDPRVTDRALSIIVLDQDGREVHREPVYPDD